MTAPSQGLALALEYHQKGKLREAEDVCRQVLEREPRNAAALHLLGVLAHRAGWNDVAAERLRQAVALCPGNPEFRYNLGVAEQMLGRVAEAVANYEEALRLRPDHAEGHNNLGYALLRLGRVGPALTHLREALRLRPDYPEALNNLALALSAQGKRTEAVTRLQRAIELRPDLLEAQHNLGRALVEQGKLDEARAPLEQAVRLNPSYYEAHTHLGQVHLHKRRLDEARASFERALRLRPDHAEPHSNLGVALHEQGKVEEAIACFRKALEIDPNSATAHNNLGRALEEQGKVEEAIACFRAALRCQPDHALALHNLANALTRQDRGEEAVPYYREALRLQPRDAVALSNLANALVLAGRPDEAEACAREAVRLRPDFAIAYHHLAIARSGQGDVAEALALNEQALRLQPDLAGAHNCRALWWLQTGDFERGWAEMEWRWKIGRLHPRSFREPTWDGSPLGGRTILIHAEQGLGDALQFIRYARLVKERGGTVVVECPKALVRILASCPGIDRLVAAGSPLPPFDVQAPLVSLPRLLGTTLATVPADVPYLFADADLVERWQRELSGYHAFRVGIAWQGNPKFPGDRTRSIPLRHYAPLARVEGVRLFSLQKGAGSEQLREPGKDFPVIDLGRVLDEKTGAFMDTAAVMKNLDLVITSDTAVAHLAGALGVPVWVALGVGADWRFLRDREDSPWYPTRRLFRQTRLHDWEPVFERMAAELRRQVLPARPRQAVPVAIAPGELIDKLTILEIKAERVGDAAKLRNVRTELEVLTQARQRWLRPSPALETLTADLKAVNAALWEIEDEIRLCERAQDFGPRFVELARSVYKQNDRRAALKRRINELLGSDLVEEKAYTPYEAPTAPPRRRATVCILTYGDYLPYFRRCLESVLAHTPPGEIELRLGLNAAPESFREARERLLPEEGAADSTLLARVVERVSFVGPGGMPVRMWNSPGNLYKEPMARLLYHDLPLTTEYAVWFDDDSYVEAGWWQALTPLLDRHVDYIGQPWWVDYLPGQADMIRAQSWYRGLPFDAREGRPGVEFMTGGFMAVRAERLRQANFPDTEVRWKGDSMKQYGGDTLLGEIARQLGWTREVHDRHIKVNVDLEDKHPAPRRGGTGRQFGSDVDVAIR